MPARADGRSARSRQDWVAAMNSMLWVTVLLLVGLVVMVLEVFVPSGGILGFVSITAIIAAVATAFLELGPVAGMSVLGLAVVAVPAVLSLAFRWFPDTPLGRRVLPLPPDAAEMLPDPQRRRRARDLVGRSGRAVSELLPWGSVEIDGTRCEAMSESGPIDAGTPVEAVGVQGTKLVVRVAETGRSAGAAAAVTIRPFSPESDAGPPAGSANEPPGGEPRLSQTLEEFEFDRFDPPAA